MKARLESTSKIVELGVTLVKNGEPTELKAMVPARVWQGVTDKGIPFVAFVTRVMVAREQDNSQFEAELQETKAPSPDVAALPARMIL